MDIMVCTPCYDGKVYMEYNACFVMEQELAGRHGHRLLPAALKGGALVTTSRNQCVNEFLGTHMDRMVFVDADISWKPGSLLRVALNPRPMVCGVYRKRQEEEGYAVHLMPGKNGLADDGCYPLAGIPFGFVALSRAVFKTYQDKFPDRWHMQGGVRQPVFFHAPYADHAMWGEDIAFCFDYRAAGGEIWADTAIDLNHHDGPCTFTGNFWEWLKKQQKETT